MATRPIISIWHDLDGFGFGTEGYGAQRIPEPLRQILVNIAFLYGYDRSPAMRLRLEQQMEEDDWVPPLRKSVINVVKRQVAEGKEVGFVTSRKKNLEKIESALEDKKLGGLPVISVGDRKYEWAFASEKRNPGIRIIIGEDSYTEAGGFVALYGEYPPSFVLGIGYHNWFPIVRRPPVYAADLNHDGTSLLAAMNNAEKLILEGLRRDSRLDATVPAATAAQRSARVK